MFCSFHCSDFQHIPELPTSGADRIDSFPVCNPAIADLLSPVFSDLLSQFSAGLCTLFSVSVNGHIQLWPLTCKISWVLFSFGTCALVQCPTDSPTVTRIDTQMKQDAQHRTSWRLWKKLNTPPLTSLTRYRKTSAIVPLQTPVPKKDSCKS